LKSIQRELSRLYVVRCRKRAQHKIAIREIEGVEKFTYLGTTVTDQH
jgi:hypothetical protein